MAATVGSRNHTWHALGIIHWILAASAGPRKASPTRTLKGCRMAAGPLADLEDGSAIFFPPPSSSSCCSPTAVLAHGSP
eukprot:1617212-Pyramimonas_sp.AAC.1